jgi:hypothetical protein
MVLPSVTTSSTNKIDILRWWLARVQLMVLECNSIEGLL